MGWASGGADRDKTGSRTHVANDETGTGAIAGAVATLGAEKEALLDYVQVGPLLMAFPSFSWGNWSIARRPEALHPLES